jgi:hypothetical protein
MSIDYRWSNGLVFGISHHYFLDFDAVEAKTFEEKVEEAPAKPMIFIHLGPIQLIITW